MNDTVESEQEMSAVATYLTRLEVSSEDRQRFDDEARLLSQQSRAREPGLVRYEYWRAEDEGVYYVLAVFRDARAFLEHQTSDHHEKFARDALPLIQTLRLEWLEPLDGRTSGLPSTQPMDVDGSQDPGFLEAAARFPIVRPPWWP